MPRARRRQTEKRPNGPARLPLAGKVALVTGAGRGIGRAIALQLASEGARVFVNYRADSRAARSCVADIVNAGGEAQAIRADVSEPAAVRRMLDKVAVAAERLDILVANAGIAPVERRLAEVTPALWRRTIETNATGAFYCAQAAAPLIIDAGGGSILFVGSVAARLGGNIGPHYAASKAALRGLMAWLARDLGPTGITVNLIEPGYVRTDISAGFYTTAAGRRRLRSEVPLRRIGTTEDVAATAAFLVGPGARYITGEHVAVAGGR
jgi:3-oxoacyl-[acyl-carrier protein] reductase